MAWSEAALAARSSHGDYCKSLQNYLIEVEILTVLDGTSIAGA